MHNEALDAIGSSCESNMLFLRVCIADSNSNAYECTSGHEIIIEYVLVNKPKRDNMDSRAKCSRKEIRVTGSRDGCEHVKAKAMRIDLVKSNIRSSACSQSRF